MKDVSIWTEKKEKLWNKCYVVENEKLILQYIFKIE
jgi:hypothetical protein